MNNSKNSLVIGFSTASLLALSTFMGNAAAIDRVWTDSSGQPYNTGYRGCWEGIGGTPGLCGKPAPKDSDGDGVYDDRDKCPGTPKGAKVDRDGCELDSDGDGVVDSKDRCPATPRGARVDRHGCELDSDGDGVVDSKDRCPGTPRGAKVDSRGCELDADGDGVVDSMDSCRGTPKGAIVDSEGCMQKLVLRNIRFKLNSAELTPAARATLQPIADVLKGRPDIKGMTVVGHTDSSGSDAYNLGLSKARAQSVATFFKKSGVDIAFETSGMGERKPVADNRTEDGRAQNRRVELGVIK